MALVKSAPEGKRCRFCEALENRGYVFGAWLLWGGWFIIFESRLYLYSGPGCWSYHWF